jgi:hypothetical protein
MRSLLASPRRQTTAITFRTILPIRSIRGQRLLPANPPVMQTRIALNTSATFPLS